MNQKPLIRIGSEFTLGSMAFRIREITPVNIVVEMENGVETWVDRETVEEAVLSPNNPAVR